jgi:hypothetical protein
VSCFIVSNEHINALVWLVHNHGATRGAPDRDRTGRALLDANIRSFANRYWDSRGDAGREAKRVDAAREATVAAYHWEPIARAQLTVVEGLKLAQCFAYQSNEWGNWPHSEAFRIIADLKEALICALPDYEQAPWAI